MTERLSMMGGTRMTEPGVRVLLTGATGFVGTRLSSHLLMNRCEVVALARNPAAAQERIHAITRAWEWTDTAPVPEQAAQGVDAIIHLAGEPVAGRWNADKKRRIEASRVEGTRRVVDAIEALPENQRPLVLVSASAIGYYGDTGDADVTEEHAAGPESDFLARVCVGWEREAMRAEALGVRVVRVRIGLVMGQDGGALAQMLPLFKSGLGGRIGSGKQWWPWIHIDDVIGLIHHAISNDTIRGAMNASAPEPVQQAEFAEVLARVLRRPAFLPAPAFAIRAVLGEFADEILGSRKVLPAVALASGYEFKFSQLEPALTDLLRT